MKSDGELCVLTLPVPAGVVEKRMELSSALAPRDDKPRAKWNTADSSRCVYLALKCKILT